MAEAIGIASGILGLTTFALQSGKLLYESFERFKNQPRSVRELKEELDAFTAVLNSLRDTVTDSDINLDILETPLLRSGQACKEFALIVAKCASRSGKDDRSFRGWVTLTYREKDIGGFRSLIAAYKSTIAIALADSNIRQLKVTTGLLREYKGMIDSTISDLHEILQATHYKSHQSIHGPATPEDTTSDETSLQQERASLTQCLDICTQVASHIEELQMTLHDETSPKDAVVAVQMDGSGQARLLTNRRLADCKVGINFTSAELRNRLQEAEYRLARLSTLPKADSDEANPGAPTTSDEIDSIRQCLSICAEATEQASKDRVNVIEDVSIEDDSHQVVVATLGDLISAKRVKAGARSVQWIGQMSDTSLQQLSKSEKATEAARRHSEPQIHSRDGPRPGKGGQAEREGVFPNFANQHGIGRTLT